MISGLVNADLEATISLVMLDVTGQPRPVETIIDTGFTGFLTLPAAQIASLGLAWVGTEEVILGDGSVALADVFSATLIWEGQPRPVEVEAAETDPLSGMALLQGHDLCIRVVAGGPVTVEAVP